MLEILGALLLLIFAIFYSVMSWAVVGKSFYVWFILPVFPNLPMLSYAEIVGILFFTSVFFKNHSTTSIKEEYREKNGEIVTGIILPWVFLFFGWIFHIIVN